MVKSELITILCQLYPSLQKTQLTAIVDLIFAELTQGLKTRRRIEIRGFGSFTTRKRLAKIVKNPSTQKLISVEARYLPYFRASKVLLQQLNLS